MRKLFIIAVILFFINEKDSFAQDPHFSQFFVAPQFVNPSIVGTSYGDWRVMCNWRQQWGNAGTPFNTQAFAGEYKLLGREEDENTLAAGGAMMLDQSMYGAFRSTYALGTVAYHARLSSFGDHGGTRLGMGIMGLYGNRHIDYSRLTFGEQFTSGGFDVSLPNGETMLASFKPFFALNAGMIYNYTNGSNLNFDIGAAVFNINRPKYSFTNDAASKLPIRYLGHADMEYSLSNTLSMSFNGVFQQQALQSYFAIGGAMGIDLEGLGDREKVLFAGGWFREGDSFYPYTGFLINNIQIGLSYDVTYSKQNLGPNNPRSLELSLIIKNRKDKPGVIPCPGGK